MKQVFTAQLHSTDASAGIAVPLYLSGSRDAYTLKSNEYLEVTSILHAAAVAGDSHVFVSPTNSPSAGETISRLTAAANGGVARQVTPSITGETGDTLWVIAPAGVVDVAVEGYIRTSGGTNTTRPSWKETQLGQ